MTLQDSTNSLSWRKNKLMKLEGQPLPRGKPAWALAAARLASQHPPWGPRSSHQAIREPPWCAWAPLVSSCIPSLRPPGQQGCIHPGRSSLGILRICNTLLAASPSEQCISKVHAESHCCWNVFLATAVRVRAPAPAKHQTCTSALKILIHPCGLTPNLSPPTTRSPQRTVASLLLSKVLPQHIKCSLYIETDNIH